METIGVLDFFFVTKWSKFLCVFKNVEKKTFPKLPRNKDDDRIGLVFQLSNNYLYDFVTRLRVPRQSTAIPEIFKSKTAEEFKTETGRVTTPRTKYHVNGLLLTSVFRFNV